MLILTLLYELSNKIMPQSPLAKATAILGRYSLVNYIVQIGFLQMFAHLLARPRYQFGYEIVLIVGATVVFLLALSAVLDFLRSRHRSVNEAYKLIFS